VEDGLPEFVAAAMGFAVRQGVGRVTSAKVVGQYHAVVVIGIHQPAEGHLFLVGRAGDGASLLPGLGQSREEHGGQNRNDADDDEQLD